MKITLVLMSTVLALCYCSKENNITFHANKTTWNEAVVYCANSGGVLYSDEADIRNRTDDELYNTDDVWTGIYQAFSPWAITWGCYRVNFGDNSKDVFTVSYAAQQECQTKCTDSDFFAIKGTICKCLHATEVDEQRKENINPCTCSTCVTVQKHRIDNVDIRSNTGCLPTNRDCTCIAAVCIEHQLKRTPELCYQYYGVVCDTNKTTSSRGFEEAIQFCYEQNSVLRWYTSAKDICGLGLSQFWTSGRRSVYQYIVQYKDEVSRLNPLRCLRVKKRNNQGSEYVDCNRQIPFFCKTGDNTFVENTSPNDNGHRDNHAGVIIGIVVSITVVLLLTVLILSYLRIHSKDQLPDILAGSTDSNTHEMHNNTVMSNYEQLDNTDEDKRIKVYDRLDVTHNPGHDNDQVNTMMSIEEIRLSNTNKMCDNTNTSDYEQLDAFKKDTDRNRNAYDQLHIKHGAENNQNNGHSTTIIAREEYQNFIEQTDKIDNYTALSEYEHFDSGKDDSTNAYDQLDVTHKEENAPTKNHL